MKDERQALLVVSKRECPPHQARQTPPPLLDDTTVDARTPTVPIASASPLLCAVCANRVADISGLLERGGIQKGRLIRT